MDEATRKARAAELREYQSRWQRVNAFTDEEYRRTPVAERIRQFFYLLNQARALNWRTTCETDLKAVRARWRKLHEAQGG
jgi:hypothetical protein